MRRDRSQGGSSPRLRGTPDLVPLHKQADRIIPAPAGNTIACTAATVSAADHPRACGEHLFFGRVVLDQAGSSPRLRGTRLQTVGIASCRRIIPAPAGNTGPGQDKSAQVWDHPRACGEHRPGGSGSGGGPGSSPRLRGTLHTPGACTHRPRIIPAPAGNTMGH